MNAKFPRLLASLALTALLTVVVTCFGILLPCPAHAADNGKRDQPGPYKVTALEQDWTDTARSRTLPVRIYLPDGAPGPRPVIVWSHGLGGNRNAGEMWGRHWASYGYISVHLQHPGSDESVWRGEIKDGDMDSLKDFVQSVRDSRTARTDDKADSGKKLRGGANNAVAQKLVAAANPANAKLRAEDASFALNKLAELNTTAGSPFNGRVDLEKAGICGHSFGGNTTLLAAGMASNPLAGGKAPLKEPRFKAAIAFSAPPGRSFGNLSAVFGGITIPVLNFTGTEDKSPITGQMDPKDRRRPYDNMKPGHKMLVILDGGDHGIFHGKRAFQEKPKDAEHQRIIRETTLAFWNAFLMGNTADEAWLEKGGLAADVGKGATVEVK